MSLGPYTYEYPKADITVDVVALGVSPDWRFMVAMVRRGEDPFLGQLALPGGFIEFIDGETAEQAARRELLEEAGIVISYMEQLRTFDAPYRDPRGRVFSVAYVALVRTIDHAMVAGSDAAEALWLPVDQVLRAGPRQIAFDHKLIVQTAVERLRNKIRYTPVGFDLLPETFTLSDLRRLYETILGRGLENPNFRRKVHMLNARTQDPETEQGMLEIVGTEQASDASRSGPPAKLYRFNKAAYERAVRDGINFEL